MVRGTCVLSRPSLPMRAHALLLLACLLLLSGLRVHADTFQTQDPGPGSVKIGGA